MYVNEKATFQFRIIEIKEKGYKNVTQYEIVLRTEHLSHTIFAKISVIHCSYCGS